MGANLKYYRKQRRLSQEKLSEYLDITPKHLCAIETGAAFVSAELLERLTETLDVSASALFYTVEEKSGDDSLLNMVDQIVDSEMAKVSDAIKIQIRHSQNA